MKPPQYIKTDEKIKEAYTEYIKSHSKMPTQQQIADICNISRKTVNVHLNNIALHDIVKPFKIFSENVLMGLGNKAVKGDAQAAKLYFMLVYDWREKTEHEVKGETKHIIEVRYEDEK